MMMHTKTSAPPRAGQRTPLIVGLGGSTRDDSISGRLLLKSLAFAESLGAQTTAITGSALPKQIYTPHEPARSPEAVRLVELLRLADGVIVAAPAYHGSVSGFVKNALDYVEDLRGDIRPYLDGRPMGMICCAMGPQAGGATLSALRSIAHALRAWPTPLGVIVDTSQAELDPQHGERIDAQLKTAASQVVQFCRAQLALSGT